MPIRAVLILLIATLAGCARNPGTAGGADVAVAAAAETEPSAEDGANGVAIWIHPDDGARSLILGAAGTGGLEVYGFDGRLRQRIDDIEASHVNVRYGFDVGGRTGSLVLVYDPVTSSVHGFAVGDDLRLLRLPGEPIQADDELTGLCSFRSPVTGRVFALGMTDTGEMLQWEIYAAQGKLKGRLVRSVPLGQGIEYCAVDDARATMYYGDEALGVMSVPVGPESEPMRKPLDLASPRGGIAEEVKGVALATGANGESVLVVSDASAERLAIYGLDGALKGRFKVGAGKDVDAVGEVEGLALAALALGPAYPEGILAVADEDNDGEHGNYKLIGWREVRTAIGLAGQSFADPRIVAAATERSVMPTLETVPAKTWGDAADDPAIWAHPHDPERSVVIATDKNLGLYVYDLDGQLIQSLPDGRMNNVDVRDGFVVDGTARTLVAASNRTDKTIALYFLDPATRRLARAGDPVPTGFGDPYGLCMYMDASGHYVFVNDGEDGLHRQWRITAEGDRVSAERVRDIPVGSQAEGCAADDETGNLFIAEEDVGLWKYSAKPDGGTARTAIDRVGGPNGLVADVEGVELWQGPDGTGYLVASNQGADNYAVYRREGDNAFVGLFQIVADPERGIDGVSETDGLDVTGAPLGAIFPEGMMVVQDGRNLSPRERQNYKYVSWRAVAEALGLNE